MARRELWTPETSGLESLRRGMEASALRPQGNDPVIRAIGMACLQELTEPYFRSFVEETIGERAPIHQNHAAGVMRTLIQWLKLYPDLNNQFEMTDEPDPFASWHWRGHARPKPVRNFIREKLDYDSPFREPSAYRARNYNVGTVSLDRHTLPMIVLSIIERQHPGYFGEAVDVLDMGCSNLYGLKWLALQKKFKENALRPPRVKEKLFPKHRKGYTRYGTNQDQTLGLEQLWDDAPELGIGEGVDNMHFQDEDANCWRRSSPYPSSFIRKRTNPAYNDLEFDEFLEMMAPRNVKFHLGDITKVTLDELKASLGEYKDEVKIFDVAWEMTTFYELAPPLQAPTLENMSHMARLVMLHEFGRVDPNDPSRFNVSDKGLGEAEYTLAVGSTEAGKLVLHEWFISESGRVKDAVLGPGFGWFNGEQIFTPDDLAKIGASRASN